MPTTDESANNLSGITASVTKYIQLLVEDTRLNVAEKLTRMLSAIALCALLTIIGTAALVFISLAVGLALAEVLEPMWAFIIVASFYIVVLVLLVCCRTLLLVNPISRFISRLLLPAPKPAASNDQSAPVS